MRIEVDCSGSAAEEINLVLELNPPPEFRTVQQGVAWAIENLPINTYFELIGPSGIVRYSGHVGMPTKVKAKARQTHAQGHMLTPYQRRKRK